MCNVEVAEFHLGQNPSHSETDLLLPVDGTLLTNLVFRKSLRFLRDCLLLLSTTVRDLSIKPRSK